MKRSLVFLFCALFTGLLATAACADEWSFTPRVGLKQVDGKTSYDITIPVNGPQYARSKLEFDLGATLLGIGMDVSYRNHYMSFLDQMVLSADYYTSVATTSGTLRDRDWFYNFPGYTTLQGDTKSSIDSDAKIYDLRYTFVFTPFDSVGRVRMTASLGYLHQEWGRMSAHNLRGTYGPLLSGTGSTETVNEAYDSAVINYDVTYKIPYVGVGLIWDITDRIGLKANVDFSSAANARDRDDHVLRGKVSRSDCDGNYLDIGGEIDWKIFPSLTLAFEISYMTIDADGTQRQYDYVNGHYIVTDLDTKIKSDQTYYGAKLAYTF